MENTIRAEFIVSGLVQGVGFRYYVFHNATSLGLNGFTRNLWDGTVYVIAEGDKHSIGQLHNHLRIGPMMAHVKSVQVEYDNPTNEFEIFDIR
jgi:acylphosphatase